MILICFVYIDIGSRRRPLLRSPCLQPVCCTVTVCMNLKCTLGPFVVGLSQKLCFQKQTRKKVKMTDEYPSDKVLWCQECRDTLNTVF